MQILVFVIIIAGYALSAILKTKAKKAQGEEKEQQPQQPSGLKWQREYRPIGKPKAKKVSYPQPAVSKLSIKIQQARPLQTIKTPEKFKPSEPTLKIQPKSQELPKLQPEIAELPQEPTITVPEPSEVHEAIYLGEIVSDYADLEELRRAILHYEILGKPLSLRGPGEHLIGL
jgi:hypothetical protein